MTGRADWIAYSQLLADHLDGTRAQAHVQALAPFYRSPGSPGYDAAVDYITEVLTVYGVPFEVRSVELDGKTPVLGDPAPRAWDPRGGRLDIVSPEPETLVVWDDCPSCLPWWCPPTPDDGVLLELVDVGTGERDEDFSEQDVAGKAVLVHDARENFAWFDIAARAARFGAKGIVTNYLIYQYEPWRTRSSVPDAVQQLRLPSRRDDNPWTFSIDQPAFGRLRELLASAEAGQVVLRFSIDAQTYDGTSRYVVARVPAGEGAGDGVGFFAHVTAATKPGANCASGVGLMLELAGVIKRLVDQDVVGKLARPIYLVFGNEGLCCAHWFETAKEAEDLIATMALCSVGHDQAKTRSSLIAARSPDSLPTFMNDLVECLIEESRREAGWAYREGSREISLVHWSVLPYTPWSDNATWSKLGVPSLLFMSLPDRYFHTQLLTPDKTDAAVFERCGQVTGAAALVAATAGWPEAADLIQELARRTAMRISRLRIQAGRMLREDATDEAARLLDQAQWTLERDGRALRSVLDLVGDAEDRREAEELIAKIEAELREGTNRAITPVVAAALSDPAASNGGPRIVLERRTRSIPHGVPGLDYADMLAVARDMAELDAGVGPETLQILVDELWNLSTGEWTLDEITRILGHEFGLRLRTDDVRRLAEGLERAEYIERTSRSPSTEEA